MAALTARLNAQRNRLAGGLAVLLAALPLAPQALAAARRSAWAQSAWINAINGSRGSLWPSLRKLHLDAYVHSPSPPSLDCIVSPGASFRYPAHVTGAMLVAWAAGQRLMLVPMQLQGATRLGPALFLWRAAEQVTLPLGLRGKCDRPPHSAELAVSRMRGCARTRSMIPR